MTGSIVIDVAIGLIVVYLMYSLLVTVTGELVATSFTIRGRLLKYAIERMFNDQSPSWAQSVWLAEGKNFRYSFAKRFYDQPSVKYLTKRDSSNSLLGFLAGKPSYLSPQNFADTIIHLFRAKGEGATDSQKIQYCLRYNTLQIEAETLSHLNNLFMDCNGDVVLFKEKLKQWFNETMDRATGWYKRKLQGITLLIAFITTICFNVDTIEIAKKLANDSSVRDQMVQIGIQASNPESPLAKALTHANDTATADSLLLKTYFELNKATREASSIVGMGWDFSDRTQDTLIRIFTSNAEATSNKLLADSIIQQRQHLLLLIHRANEETLAMPGYRDSLYADLERTTSGLAGWGDAKCMLALQIDSCISIDDKTLGLVVRRELSLGGKAWYVITQVFSDKMKLAGLIITTLMLSLGAPFWFDTLKKIVAIRGAGTSPEEKKPGAKDPVQPPPPTDPPGPPGSVPPAAPGSELSGDAFHTAVQQVKQTIKEIPGINVMPGFSRQAGTKIQAIEVHGASDESITQAKQMLGEKLNEIPIVYLKNPRGESHQCEPGSTVSNKAGLNGLGTLGLYCRKDSSSKAYLVSCLHVLKANSKWNEFTADENRSIIDRSGSPIANLTDGAISPKIDVGFGELTATTANNDHLRLSASWRTVTKNDSIQETSVRFHGATSGPREDAVIYHHTVPVKLDYPGGPMKFEDVFSITVFDDQGNRKAPSKKGDSGSVVVDVNGFPLGLVIGGDGLYSYVAKFSNIMADTSPFTEYKIIV